MDKHKQFTETKHPVGTVLEPAMATPLGKAFTFSEDDLASDFADSVQPQPASSPVIHQAPLVEPPKAKQPEEVKDLAPKPPKQGGGPKALARNRTVWVVGGVVLLIICISVGMFLGKRYMRKAPQVITDSSKIDQTTLLIDSNKHSVGVATGADPDGLEVQSKVSATPQGTANIRMGLINGNDPSILFEDAQKNSWQVLAGGGSFQIIQGTQTRAKLDDKALSLTNALNVGSDANVAGSLKITGNTTLGNDGGNQLTIQGTKVVIPNNLNFGDNTFFIEASKGNVAIGAGTANGNKLYVAGTIKSTSNIYADGQVLAGTGSAKNPSFSFGNNTNTGIYEASLNVVGVAVAGSQVLQVQSGSVFTVNGANIEADGYLRSGRGGNNPFFQLARFTGTLDGSGNATVNDGLGNGNTRVISVQAFYRGNSSEALPLNIDAVTGSTIQISGGIPGRQYRATIMYSLDAAGW
jgi:hypothetical protein